LESARGGRTLLTHLIFGFCEFLVLAALAAYRGRSGFFVVLFFHFNSIDPKFSLTTSNFEEKLDEKSYQFLQEFC
jgi:hypothetical protein